MKVSELGVSLGTLGLLEYSEPLASHGFKTWEDVISISEDSLANVGLKLGHRRKLQREIASYKGKPYGQPLVPIPTQVNLDKDNYTPQLSPEQNKMEIKQSLRPKRKYRPRLPKDSHAPLRPKSDYVHFANCLRENPEVADMSFVEISRWVGKQWQGLLPDERAAWSSLAAQEKDKYKIEFAVYKETDQYKEHQQLLHARKVFGSGTRNTNKSKGNQEEQMECSSPIYDTSKSKDAKTQMNKYSPSDKYMTTSSSEEQEHKPVVTENATNSNTHLPNLESSGTGQDSCTLSDCSDNQEMDFVPYGESPTVASQDRDDTIPHQMKFNSGDGSIGVDVVYIDAKDSPQNIQSFHLQALNPFQMISHTSAWSYLESFLTVINKHYYVINPDTIIRQFNMALTIRLPNIWMCTLCISISVGCQIHREGSEEMAIMWYENGRRYLDSDDWGWSLKIMRAMALVSLFHRIERPMTAQRYLGIALQIGEANDLPTMISGDYLVEDTTRHEWVLLWNTIQAIVSEQ